MKRSIFETICYNKGYNYCNCVEVSSVYELEEITEFIIDEFRDTHTITEITEFLSNLDVYALEDEDDIHDFNLAAYARDLMI